LSQVFSALADPTRRDIVARLAVADATVNELAKPYDVTVQAVSRHLKVLGKAGLVSRSKKAQHRPVHLEAEVFDLMTKWIERYRAQAQERYERLDVLLLSMPDAVETSSEDQKHGRSAEDQKHGQEKHRQQQQETPKHKTQHHKSA
jgi:DNA-binding transcriptional ArsR family regulator